MAERFIDAALSDSDGSHEATFILGDQFVVYNYDRDRVNDGVHAIGEFGFPVTLTPVGVGASVDAALKGRKQFSGTGYLFKSASYGRLDLATNAGDPSLSALSGWQLPSPLDAGVDAACNGHAPTRDGKGYFFRADQYVRYDWPQDRPDGGYPQPISNMVGMAGMAPAFTSGIDAAVDGEGAFEEFSYLFREDRYVRFSWNPAGGGEPLADSPDASIQDNWSGLAELLAAGKAKTQALAWSDVAQSQLIAFLALLGSGTPFPFDRGIFDAAFATHFHVDPSAGNSTKAAAVSQILASFSGVSATLKQSATNFRFRTPSEVTADGNTSDPGAYSFFDATINFTGQFLRRGPMNRAASVLHESVHIIDNLSGSSTTHIPEWYVTDAAADALGLAHQPNRPEFGTRYDLMVTADALHDASSYAAFGQHLANRADTRFGEGHSSQ